MSSNMATYCHTGQQWLRTSAGTRLNIKMSSYQYRKSHCGDKMVVRSSYLHNGVSYTGKMSSLYWIGALTLTPQLFMENYNVPDMRVLEKNKYHIRDLGPDSIKRCHLTSIGNPIVEIRRSYDRLISTMGFPILVRWHLYIESGPWPWKGH